MKNNLTKSLFPLSLASILFLGCDPDSTAAAFPENNSIHNQEAQLGEACFKSDSQPSICNYGEYCAVLTSKCTGVPRPTCQNFSIHGASWDANTSNGPVIYEARAIRFATDYAFCGVTWGTTRATFRIRAYAPSADLPTSLDGFGNQFRFVNPAGNEVNASALQNIVTTNDRKHITFDVNLCLANGPTSYTAGFYFVGGNEVCVTAS